MEVFIDKRRETLMASLLLFVKVENHVDTMLTDAIGDAVWVVFDVGLEHGAGTHRASVDNILVVAIKVGA